MTPRRRAAQPVLRLDLISGTDCQQTAVELGRDALLLLYMDGVTESRNGRGDELGPEGLLALVRGISSDPAKGLRAFGRILGAEVKAFRGNGPQPDDETLTVIQRETRFDPMSGWEQILPDAHLMFC